MAKILVVDDQPDSVRLIGLVLQHNRHEVTTIDNPASAFIMLRGRPFDLVIADQNMPGMTGQALLDRVGQLFPKTARLMLTADPRMKDDKSLPYRVMHKPYKVEELRGLVEQLLKQAAGAKLATSLGGGAPTPAHVTPPHMTPASIKVDGAHGALPQIKPGSAPTPPNVKKTT